MPCAHRREHPSLNRVENEEKDKKWRRRRRRSRRRRRKRRKRRGGRGTSLAAFLMEGLNAMLHNTRIDTDRMNTKREIEHPKRKRGIRSRRKRRRRRREKEVPQQVVGLKEKDDGWVNVLEDLSDLMSPRP